LLLVWHRELAGCLQHVEGRAFLYSELVERQVVGRMPDRLPQLARPGFDGLAGAGVDQVEGKPREGFARQPDRVQSLLDIMQSAEELEVGVVQRLYAQRNAVDAGVAITPKTGRLDR